ncbi:hypothetical protein AB0D30_31340 [Streptomyces sp. NPDC048409]|uniref:hypothetical protein n=1 Tax=Streptomyces sp. NPDC048409 TaxID=3154723 RepID=UPI00342EA042
MPVTVGNTVYGAPGTDPSAQIKKLVEALKDVGLQVGPFGRILAGWIKSGNHVYLNYNELAADLSQQHAKGQQINDIGDMLEATAAQYLGAWTGRSGGGVPHWASGFVEFPPGGQDPNVYQRDAVTGGRAAVSTAVKPDIWSEDVLGIVGGPAKDRNLQKFETICHDLVRVSLSHGKRPVVFAALGAVETVTSARDIVGASNTYVQDRVGGGWRPLG